MASSTKNPASMSFLEHTKDLRKRIIRSAIVIALTMFGLVYFSDKIFGFLSSPVREMGYELYGFKVQDAVLAVMNSCFWAAILVTSPFWLSQLLGFILPAFTKRQKRTFWGFLSASGFFIVSGFAFSYLVLIPMTIRFLLSFSSASFRQLVSAVSYVDFFLTFFFLTGLAFQFPLIMLILDKAGIIDSAWIRKNRRIAIVGIAIMAAIITPPDVVSMIALAVPMYVLFELGAILCRISEKSKKAATIRAEAIETTEASEDAPGGEDG
jgi:sec-independent protein translocase protein TatC